MLLDARRSVLFIVDIQARLAPAIADADAVIARTAILLAAAARLGVPIVVSEQYPQGLGHTDERLLPLPEGAAILPKTSFSALGDAGIRAHLAGLGRRQVVLAGMETHICVLQTALGLREAGYAVAVAADAVGSRRPDRRDSAWNGCAPTASTSSTARWWCSSGWPTPACRPSGSSAG